MKTVPTHAAASSLEPIAARDTRLVELLEQYGTFLHRIILRACPVELGLSCDDIEQEARISLWKVLQGEREIAYPASYVYKVGVSAARRAIRRVRARREDPLEEESDASGAPPRILQAPANRSPEHTAAGEELIRRIEASVATLADNRRRAVELHLQGLTTREIGDLLGWSEPKARNLVSRGLKDLRNSLRAIGIEYRP